MRLLLVSLAVIVIAGCDNSKWQVSCDSGYSTGPHKVAYVSSKGLIEFGPGGRNITKRKMIPGEACQQTEIKP